MSDTRAKYDDSLSTILLEQKSIIGFLSTIFDFLARRTDFYYVPDGKYENIGFPPGVAEELTVKVLRNCDPKRPKLDVKNPGDVQSLTDDILCSTVAQEVEVEADDDEDSEQSEEITMLQKDTPTSTVDQNEPAKSAQTEKQPTDAHISPEQPKLPPTQRNSEAFNGAVREHYSWAQTITDLDITIHLPAEVKSSKDLSVRVTATDICVTCCRNRKIVDGAFSFKVKAQETYWSLSSGRLLIHLEKQQERWWKSLITTEEEIDLSKIDCSRPLDELPDDQVAKVRELQWNHERKLMGLPTSEEMRNMEILKKAWNMDGSPFKGQEFDPSVLRP